jgi:bacteriocin biosynthesis cyclodehydratase domain-containing protein
MAATVRLTRTSIIGSGPIGCRVADVLAAALPDSVRRSRAELDTAFASGGGPVVVALWRPERTICERADSLAFRYGRSWLPIVVEHPVLRVGPLVCPPSGPCFGCYQARRRQHSEEHEVAVALEAAYERSRNLGPAGYLPHHARLAAGVAEQMVREPTGQVGRVVTISLLSGSLTASWVVACHDCPRQPAPHGSDGADLRLLIARRARARARRQQTGVISW